MRCLKQLDLNNKMIRTNEEVMVIDNKSKNDITAATLTQIIFEAEKKASQYAPLEIVKLADIGYSGVSSIVTLQGATHFMKRIRRRSSGDIVKHSIDNEICLKSSQ